MSQTAAMNEYDQEVFNGRLVDFIETTKKLDDEIRQLGTLVSSAFKTQRDFLEHASVYERPDDAGFQKLLVQTSNAIADIEKYRQSRRSSPHFNHFSAISESIPALAWVTITPAPAPYIKEMNDAGQFYTNRVLKDFKDKPGHAEFVKCWILVWQSLQAFVKKHHTTGLVWGKQKAGSGNSGPSAPPPPPMGNLSLELLESYGGPMDDKAALFAELNKGEDITSRLKKVTTKGPVTDKLLEQKPGSQNNTVKGKTRGFPRFTLDGKKWIIENQLGMTNMKIEDDRTQMNHVVYIYGCSGSTLNVKAKKINSIVVDSCEKTAVVFNSLVASVEFVNCTSCQMQVMGTVPTITIDKTDGLQMYLSAESMGVEIVSAKSSALNVLVPAKDFQTSGEFVELAIPEQYKTVISTSAATGKHNSKGFSLITSPTEIVGV